MSHMKFLKGGRNAARFFKSKDCETMIGLAVIVVSSVTLGWKSCRVVDKVKAKIKEAKEKV